MTDVTVDLTLDCTGMACPIPILKLSKALTRLEPGQVVELIATDGGSRDDVPAFCERTNNILDGRRDEPDRYIFYVRKGA